MNEKLHQLLDLCLQIQQAGEGINGHPYISVDLCNCGHDVSVYIMDNGFKREDEYDGLYHLKREGEPEEYTECENHLKELITKHNINPIVETRCIAGAACDADSCIYHDGNGRCGCNELYISDAETGDVRCLSADFGGESNC